MGGSGGIFGQSKQKAAGAFKVSGETLLAEKEALKRQSDIASGKGPMLSDLLMNKNVDQMNNQAMSFAASQRGASNPMLAFQQAQQMNQQNAMQGAQDAALMGLQERRQADQFIQQGAAAQRGVALQSAMGNQQADQMKKQGDMQMIAGAGQAAAMLSDKTQKEDIKPKSDAAGAVEDFVNALKAHTYKYKNAEDGTGEKVGIMAQDLEKSEVGKTMVDEGADGKKRVDVSKSLGPIMAALADMNKKIKKLEK